MNKKMLISLVHHAGNMSLETSSGSISSVNNLLILVTAAGQITGTLLQKENDSDPKEQIADAIFLSAANTLANHAGEDSFILLKDATLKTAGCDIAYRYLYVFTDDIIAVTIGNSNVE